MSECVYINAPPWRFSGERQILPCVRVNASGGRTQQRIVASLKTANSQCRGEIRLCARVERIHTAHFHIHVSTRVLSGTSTRQDFESAPLFFCRRRSSRNKAAAKGKVEVSDEDDEARITWVYRWRFTAVRSA